MRSGVHRIEREPATRPFGSALETTIASRPNELSLPVDAIFGFDIKEHDMEKRDMGHPDLCIECIETVVTKPGTKTPWLIQIAPTQIDSTFILCLRYLAYDAVAAVRT